MAFSRTPSRRGRKPRALSERATGKQSGGCGLVLFGLVFFLVGLGTLVWMAVIPFSSVIAARGWTAVPCTVVSSQLKSHRTSTGTSYSVELIYSYTVDARYYESDRVSFDIMDSTPTHKQMVAFVAAHPRGHTVTGYVDPSDATRAVLDRGVGLPFLWALFPLPFLAAGFFIMRAGVKSASGNGKGDRWRTPASEDADTDGGAVPPASQETGPVVLRPSKQRLGGAVGLLIFGLIWNGIISIPITRVVGSWRAGDPDICLSLFMIPFVAVGVGVMVMWLRQVLLVFAPVIELELSRSAVPVGETVELKWRVQGRLWRLTAMTIVLVGEEKATYRRGTDTHTDTHTFFEHTVAGADGSGQTFQTLPAVPERGSATLTIPADTMHSFAAPNNKVLWSLKVKGKVHRWPDPKDTYELTVLPRPITNGG